MIKGVKFVSIFMVIMILIGIMMVPASAENKDPETFEENFRTLWKSISKERNSKTILH